MVKNCKSCKNAYVEYFDPDTCSSCITTDGYAPSNWEPRGVVDQRAKADAGKPKLTLVPTRIIYDIAEVREYGNNKYPDGGPDNWKRVEVQRYRDAAFRHFLAYIKDPESVDPESGIKHRKHLECNLAFLAEMEEE